MIVFRYLSREVLVTMTAVTTVLLVIIMSGRFIKYLAQAAQGALDPSAVLLIMGYRIPGFLQLILPLGLFLGFLLAYGRLYMDSEMTVLTATGMSQQRLALYSMAPALLVALLVAWLAMELTPRGAEKVAEILTQQDSLTEFDTLIPGRFQQMRKSGRVTYVTEMTKDRSRLDGVFITEKRASSSPGKEGEITVLVADSGHMAVHPDGSRYLILEEGYRYDGNPGAANYRITRYQAHGALLTMPQASAEVSEKEAIPTLRLIGSDDLGLKVEMQWRLSLPVLVLVVALLAVPLSRVNPRQGRFLKLLPAIFLYMAYLSLLITVRGALDKERMSLFPGLWSVHALFLLIGLLLLYWEPLWLRMKARRAARQEVALG